MKTTHGYTSHIQRICRVSSLLCASVACLACASTAHAGDANRTPYSAYWPTPVSQMETLQRSVVAVPAQNGQGNLVSWRLLGYDNPATTFDLLRNGTPIATGLKGATCFVDAQGDSSSIYQVVAKADGCEAQTSPEVRAWKQPYLVLQLDRPAGGVTPAGDSYTYMPNDCSVGDVDGDGTYDLIVKWDPSDSRDNSQDGYTGNTLIDAYHVDWATGAVSRLWRVDLGVNIRAGAHYTPFLVYDFDGDGKAEMICKTGPGSKDGLGNYVSAAATDKDILGVDNAKDWRNSKGKIIGGQEYLTVFNGLTGKALSTIFYSPNRALGTGGAPGWTVNWDDRRGKTDKEYANRGERYLACVAYLDRAVKHPSAVMCRGYYTYAYLWAVDFDGTKLSTKWLHASTSKTEWSLTDAAGATTTHKNVTGGTVYANGNHNLSVADVDDDGKDEIIYGSSAVDHDGSLLYSTNLGHGDAMHLSDLDPDRKGLEVFEVHEASPYGSEMHDARTGEIIFRHTGSSDTGRGIAADVDSLKRGFEMASSDKATSLMDVKGTSYGKRNTLDFRIYWDGDAQDELFDGKYNSSNATCAPIIEKFNSDQKKFNTLVQLNSYGQASANQKVEPRSCNTTKATPCLQADVLGDWREELLLWNGKDPSQVLVYTTNRPTDYRMPTLMHDHVYRMGIAWQNVAYNQPPHLGFYLPDFLWQTTPTGITQPTAVGGEKAPGIYHINGQELASEAQMARGNIYIVNGEKRGY